MASKKLKNLAALAAAAATGYGAAKMFGSKAQAKQPTKKATGLSQSINIARQEGKEAEYNRMSPTGTGFEQRTSENMQMEPYGEKVASKGAPVVPVAQPSADEMMAGFGPMAKKGKFISKDMSKKHEGMESTSMEAKETKMEKKGYKETASGKMTKMMRGGSVIARGNKLARSRPTKLY